MTLTENHNIMQIIVVEKAIDKWECFIHMSF